MYDAEYTWCQLITKTRYSPEPQTLGLTLPPKLSRSGSRLLSGYYYYYCNMYDAEHQLVTQTRYSFLLNF